MLRCGKWVWVLAFLVTACGKNSPTGVWPAKLAGYESFSAEQETTLKQSIAGFNSNLGTEALSETAPENALQISFKLVEPSAAHPKRLGFATLTDESCRVEINRDLFSDGNQDLFEIVLWHELGHCAGKSHEAAQGEIMYKSAARARSYTSDSIQRFFKAMLVATGLEASSLSKPPQAALK